MSRLQMLEFSIQFIVILGNLLTYAIIGRILISWFSMGKGMQRGRFSQMIYDVTDPIMNLAKKVPHRIGMLDLSPIIALIAIDIFVWGVSTLLYKLA